MYTYIRRESIYVQQQKEHKTNSILCNAATYDSFDTLRYEYTQKVEIKSFILIYSTRQG
jgi:hypothetical protein